MPVTIINTTFSDNFGNTGLTAYKCNAGDRMSVRMEVHSNIRVLSSSQNYLTINAVDNQITWNNGSWLDEGFRVGDSVTITKYDTGGAVLLTWVTDVNYVDDTILDIDVLQTAGIAYNEYLEIIVNVRGRSDLDVFFNHVINGQNGSEFSLIDGEVTRLSFPALENLAIGNFQAADLIQNQSGQYIISAQIERNANPLNQTRGYDLVIDFIQSGLYDSAWFQSSDCIKPYVNFSWASLPGETANRASDIYNDDANTGWYGEAFNADLIDVTLVQGIQELDYCVPSTHTIIIDGANTDLGIGASYIPIDESYYKNRPYRQNSLGMVIPSFNINALPFAISDNNEFNAGYTINIDNINTIGSITEVTITFTPNAAFTDFMDNNRDLGDRLFYIWIKAGNVNLLAFQDQLTCELPAGDPLIMEREITYFDHSENIETAPDSKYDIEFNTEDDLAFYGVTLLEKNVIYDRLSIKIEAFNTSSEEDFTLQEVSFDFNGIQISGDGRYLLNEVQTIVNTLPSNSVKRDAKLYLDPSFDNGNLYGLAIYYPALLRWEYWIDQLNASPDFYPTQNKNWQQYSNNNTGSWITRMEILLEKDGISHPYTKNIIIKDYDSEPLIEQKIDLFIESTGQNVGVVTEGELMRVTASHKLLNGSNWDPLKTWGMITIEPKEAARRWICSSVLPFDNNLSNPLTPVTLPIMQITYPSPDIAFMECFFDPDKINLSNGVKFTSKIKGCITDTPEPVKTMTDGTIKTTTGGEDKTIAN